MKGYSLFARYLRESNEKVYCKYDFSQHEIKKIQAIKTTLNFRNTTFLIFNCKIAGYQAVYVYVYGLVIQETFLLT